MDKLQIKRVCYGRTDTPEEMREYTLINTPCPVGTLKEWQDFATSKGFDGVAIQE